MKTIIRIPVMLLCIFSSFSQAHSSEIKTPFTVASPLDAAAPSVYKTASFGLG